MVCTRARAKILGKHQHPRPQMANKFEEPKQVHEEDERPVSPQTLPLASFPLKTQIIQLSPQTPGINFMDSTQNYHPQLVLGISFATLPLESTPSLSQENVSSGAMVLYKDPLKTETCSRWRRISNNRWNREKLETLSHNFNPIPFSPKKWPLDISTYRVLLTRLSLWNFLNLDFDQNIRTDLIKELVAFYNPKRLYYCRSVVCGMPIAMSRDVVAKALFLPGKRSEHNAKGDGEGGNFVVSQEDASFLKELIWGFLVLKDDDSEVIDDYVLNFTGSMEEMRYEGVDWAGLIWFMLERELLKGQNLGSCYYASHLQLVLKYQRPKLFDDHVDKVGITGIETEAGDVKMLQLENFSFDEKMEKEICNNVVKDTIGLEATENAQKMRNILVMCRKRRGEYFDKQMKEKKSCIEENNILSELENLSKQQSGADFGDERFGIEQQMQEENQEKHQAVLLYEGEDENKRGCLTDLRCVGIDYQSVDLPWKVGGTDEVLECTTFMNSIMNHQTHEEGLKDEGSFDLMCSRMDDLNVKEMKNQLSDLIPNEQSGESSLGDSEEKVEHAVAGMIGFADEQFDTEMEHGSKELIVVHGEKEGEVMEGLVNGSECKSEAVDSLGTREEEFRNIQVDLNAERHVTDNGIALNEEGKERRIYDSSNSGEEKVENEAEFEGNTGNLFEVHCEKEYVLEDKRNEAECKGNIGEVHSEKEDDVMEDEANEADCIANIGNSLEVHCTKEDDVMENEDNETGCKSNIGNPLEKEPQNVQVDSVTQMHNACSDGYDDGSLDIDFCAGQVEVWMARLKHAAREKVQLDSSVNGKLLKKLEEQRQIIQHYEIMRQKEQQQKQKDVRKYERELQLMKNVLQEYRKALKEVHNSFSRYRERHQLADEPVYMDHPSGGGRLIPVAKWKKLEQQRVIAMVKKFEQEWMSKLEGHLDSFDSFCDKLEDLEFAVRRLKSKVEGTG